MAEISTLYADVNGNKTALTITDPIYIIIKSSY